jgi:hypothetical protein
VEATNVIGTSTPSAPSPVATPALALGDPPAWDPGEPLPPLTPELVAPTPIIDFALTTTTPVEFVVPGYVSVPQGVFHVDNPNGLDVRIEGGVLAAAMDIADSRSPARIGLDNPIIQRTFKIITETTSGAPHVVSSAIVQINQNGGWAINSWEVQ